MNHLRFKKMKPIKAKINSTSEVVDVRPYQTEKYDFMVCRNGSIMGELYMRSELTILGDNELDFVSLVKRMREAQKDEVAFESELDRKYRGNTWFMSTEEMTERQKLCNKVFDLTTEVDEYLKKMECIDQRKALEAENTEFDYGHNVKHYSED